MYHQFYKLTKEPFRLTPDAAICFRHKSFNKAKSYLLYAIHQREGLVLVTGGPGSGKTSLIADFLQESEQSLVVANVVVKDLESESLLAQIMSGFSLTNDIGVAETKLDSLRRLENYLREIHEQGSQPLLILDEAQNISMQALEELRLLNTIQVGEHPLLQFFLVGQNTLRQKILSPQLEQLRQRLLATCSIDNLEQSETADYVKTHLKQVGWLGNNPALSLSVFGLIHRFSLGTPRWINQICSRLFLHGMVEEKHQLDSSDLKIVLQDLVNEDLLPAEVRRNADALLNETPAETRLSSTMKAQYSG